MLDSAPAAAYILDVLQERIDQQAAVKQQIPAYLAGFVVEQVFEITQMAGLHGGDCDKVVHKGTAQRMPIEADSIAVSCAKLKQTEARVNTCQNNLSMQTKSKHSAQSSKSRVVQAGTPKGREHRTICQQLLDKKEKEASQIQEYRTMTLRREKIRAEMKRKTQIRRQILLEKTALAEKQSFVPIDYSGELLTIPVQKQQKGKSAYLYSRFRYSVSTSLDQRSPISLEVEKSRIREKTKNCTALKEKEIMRIPAAFTDRRVIPLPDKSTISKSQHEEDYKKKRIRFDCYRKNVNLPRLYL